MSRENVLVVDDEKLIRFTLRESLSAEGYVVHEAADVAEAKRTFARQHMDCVILDHKLPPGTKLIEDRLATAFGVSRTRIRPVLVRLANEQIVTLTPNRGASVAQPTEQEAREVFEVRRIIERRLVERFIDVAKPADVQRLADCIDEEERARAAGDRPFSTKLNSPQPPLKSRCHNPCPVAPGSIGHRTCATSSRAASHWRPAGRWPSRVRAARPTCASPVVPARHRRVRPPGRAIATWPAGAGTAARRPRPSPSSDRNARRRAWSAT